MATEPGTQEPAHAPARLKRLQQAFAAEHFREQIDALAEMTHSLLDEARGANSPVTRWTRPRELREQLEAVPVGEVQQLFDVVAQRSIRLQHPRFLGHQISPPAPIAAAAALLVDLLNNGMGVYEMGMAGTVMEREVVSLLAAKYGFPAESAAGFFTSGGSLANLTALLAARARMVPNAWAQGCPHGTILVSAAAHYCVDRAVRIMGWGEEGLTRVPVDDQFRMRTDLLESCFRQATDQGRQVVAVVGSSCCTSTGSFDDLVSIADFCQERNLWFHVDGAHGAAVVFSRTHRHLVQGIHRADSVTLDFHKLLLTPALTSALVFRDRKSAECTFSQQAEYLWAEPDTGSRPAMPAESIPPATAEPPSLTAEDEPEDLARTTFECTKSMMVLKVFAILKQHGERLFEDNIDALFELSQAFAGEIRQREEFELSTDVHCNIICFRHRGPRRDESQNPDIDPIAAAQWLDGLNAQIRERAAREGKYYLVQTRLQGQLWLRTTLSNAMTTLEDLRSLLDYLDQMATSVLKQGRF